MNSTWYTRISFSYVLLRFKVFVIMASISKFRLAVALDDERGGGLTL